MILTLGHLLFFAASVSEEQMKLVAPFFGSPALLALPEMAFVWQYHQRMSEEPVSFPNLIPGDLLSDAYNCVTLSLWKNKGPVVQDKGSLSTSRAT